MYVIKRSGKKEQVSFDKITERLNKLCKQSPQLSIDPVRISQKVVSGVYPGVTTRELDVLAAETAAYSATEHPDYSKLAARIEVSNLHKNTSSTFSETAEKLYSYINPRTNLPGPLLSDSTIEIIRKYADDIQNAIDYDRDYTYSYFGFKTLEKSYLLKINGKIAERPQDMLMRVAIGIHQDDIKSAVETYNLMSTRFFTHATPTLFNAGTPRPQMSSCFLLAMKDDSIDGIFNTLKDCAKISKYAGGIGVSVHNIRAKDSYISGTNGVSNGLVPMLQVYNDTARYVDQGGGKRKGSFAMYLEPWHADIYDFLELKKNHGKEESRARDLFYALWIPDLFMERVKSNGDWTLMCPNECPGLSDVHSKEFEDKYTEYEKAGKGRKTVRAQGLWYKILESQIETGTPYMCYKDACNSKSNQQNLGTIKSSNLCVAKETKILTSKGYKTIGDLRDENVEVWNGHEFSRVTVHQTGQNVDLLSVKLSNGTVLRCTPYHKFIIAEGYTGRSRIVPASELKDGDKLIKHELPVIKDGEDFPHAYTHGMFCADGTTSCHTEPHPCKSKAKVGEFCKRHLRAGTVTLEARTDGMCRAQSSPIVKYLDLYGDKKKLEHHINWIGNPCENIDCDRIRYQLPVDMPEKFTVPFEAKLSDKLDWLAGYLDGDGTVIKHTGGKGKSVQACSIHRNFLVEIMLMLQTVGVHSKVRPGSQAGLKTLPDGKGGKKGYECSATHRLIIASAGVNHLISLGFNPRRLDVTSSTPQRSALHFTKVENVSVDPTPSDTFCFTEPLRNQGMFGGILTQNCSEIIQYTSPSEIAVCNLASIALPKFIEEDGSYNFEQLAEIAGVCVNNLNKVIDLNYYPVKEARTSNMRHRPIGIGVQGLADVFIQMRMPWESEDARQLNKDIFESIYYGAMKASVELAKKNGHYETFKGSPLSKGEFQFDLWNVKPTDRFDWTSLRTEVMEHGARNSLLISPMPTASTSQILGNNECVEPYTSNLYARRVLAGEFPVVNPFLHDELEKHNLWNSNTLNQIMANGGSIQKIQGLPRESKDIFKTVWEIKQKCLIDMAADRGAFVCQSQSLNMFVANPTKAILTSMHFYGWKRGLKTGMYYLRSRPKVDAIQFTVNQAQLEECVACGS